jgi:predicted transcriptional regulator
MDLHISLPNEVSQEAQRLADEMEISLDQLLAQALSHYLSLQQGEHITRTLDKLYETADSRLDPAAARLQAASLRNDQW